MSRLESGSVISHYRLVSPLGEGGMGQVFLAHDEVLGRQVAIKLLPAAMESNREARERLLREARAAALLTHPNVCTIYEVGEDDGRSFIVMQYVEGEPLVERIRRGPLGIREALAVTRQIAQALALAHTRSIVHRDIKPHNVVLHLSGQATVLDFGLAKISSAEAESMTALTQSGSVAGTPPYMSPEQLRGEKLDGRSDLFSLGIVLYEMIAGRRPFDGPTTAQLITSILVSTPAPLDALVPGVPDAVQQIVRRLLEKDPARRYQRAEDLLPDIDAFLGGNGNSASPEISDRSATAVLPSPAPRRRPRARRAIESIAVLPLSNETRGDDDYLSDGIAERVINRLSRLPKLRVIARSTLSRYKGSELDPLAIGAKLGVRATLSGRMVQRGDSLLISLELADVSNGSQLWGEQYRSTGDDLFELSDRIAEEVSAAIRPRLTSSQKVVLDDRQRANPEAYQLYLKGMFHWNKRDPASMGTAIDFFRRAIEADPLYAAPYGGLAEAYMYLGFLEVKEPRDVFPKARAAAHKALELDPKFAEAHAALGWMSVMYEPDWAGAERELRTALRINPNLAVAHHWLGLVLSYSRRFDEASPELETAVQLDPLSPIMNTVLGLTLFHRGDLEGAIRMYERAFDVGGNFVPLHDYLGAALDVAGRLDEALEHIETATRMSPQGTIWMRSLGHCLARMGRTDEARAVAQRMIERRQTQYTSAFSIATVFVGLKDDDQALRWLEEALEERASWLCTLAVDRRWNRLHDHPRFVAVAKELGLDDS